MLHVFDYLRELNIVSVLVRLGLAMLCGGLTGLERTMKGRAAGFRTFMLVSLGAALSMILSQYEYEMLEGPWQKISESIGVSTDVSRFGAQVISGIGFLGAGTIIVVGRKQILGLTTAASLWVSACLGLAVGAGFYECVMIGLPLVFVCIRFLPPMETFVMEKTRHMELYLEFDSLDDLKDIILCIKSFPVQILDVDLGKKDSEAKPYDSAVFSLYLNEKIQHIDMVAALTEVHHVYTIEEV